MDQNVGQLLPLVVPRLFILRVFVASLMTGFFAASKILPFTSDVRRRARYLTSDNEDGAMTALHLSNIVCPCFRS